MQILLKLEWPDIKFHQVKRELALSTRHGGCLLGACFQFLSFNFHFRDPSRGRSITSRRLQLAALCSAIYQCHESRVRVHRDCASQQGYTIFSVTLELGSEYSDQLGIVDLRKSFSFSQETISVTVCAQTLFAFRKRPLRVFCWCCVPLHC